MKRKTILFTIAAVFLFCAVVWSAAVSVRPFGIATPGWYGYSEGAKSDYKLTHPTLSADDEAGGKAATQTLTNKTLTSPVITDGTQSGTAISSASLLTPTVSDPVVHLTAAATAAELTLTTADSGKLYTNDGATGEITINVNTTTAGDMVTVANAESYTLNVNPADTVQILGLTNAAGDAIQSTSAGDFVQIYLINSTQAAAVTRGTWSDVN
jgi:hypothetical protein